MDRKIAFIRAEDCVGCARCIPACPVDAIVGARQFLHQILSKECIGCELCVAPCPMDCIEMITLPEESKDSKKERGLKAKDRFQARQKRLARQNSLQLPYHKEDPAFKTNIQREIAEAILRTTEKRKKTHLRESSHGQENGS